MQALAIVQQQNPVDVNIEISHSQIGSAVTVSSRIDISQLLHDLAEMQCTEKLDKVQIMFGSKECLDLDVDENCIPRPLSSLRDQLKALWGPRHILGDRELFILAQS